MFVNSIYPNLFFFFPHLLPLICMLITSSLLLSTPKEYDNRVYVSDLIIIIIFSYGLLHNY